MKLEKKSIQFSKCWNIPSHVLCLWWLLHECTCSNLFWFKFLFSHSCRFPRNSLAMHIHRIHVCLPLRASESYCNVKTSRVHPVRAVHEEGFGKKDRLGNIVIKSHAIWCFCIFFLWYISIDNLTFWFSSLLPLPWRIDVFSHRIVKWSTSYANANTYRIGILHCFYRIFHRFPEI